MIYDVIIIGGGPGGLAAAMALKTTNTLILEKSDQPGKKLLISGAGQCNLTHGGLVTDFKKSYGDQWSFVKFALRAYSNQDFMNTLKNQGLELIERPDGKVFPKSLDSRDVLSTFMQLIAPIKIKCNEEVIDLKKEDLWYVQTKNHLYKSSYVIVATGGMTYPKTGSTGDGYKFAKTLNLDLKPMAYGLCPVYIKNFQLKDLQGLSFEGVSVDHYREKKIKTYKGDLLVTHFGLSGPVIINNSRDFKKGDILKVKFSNFDTKEALEQALLKAIEKEPKKQVKTLLQMYFLPQRLAALLVKVLGLEENLKGAELNKFDRKKLIQSMMAYAFEIECVGKSHIAMVTTGGVKTSNLDKKSYLVKSDPSIGFVGECVDVDGDTGGYNIQFAVSSGYLCGKEIFNSINGAVEKD